MKRRIRLAMLGVAAAALLAVSIPATADPGEGLDHSGPGSTGPDQHSQNMKLLGNNPKEGVTNSDLAFDGKLTYAGNSAGFRILNTSAPANPKVLADFSCNGSQGDVSVYGGLLFRSVDTPQSSTDCASENVTASTPGMFEGIQVFDVSDSTAPEHIGSIQTDCGSHTHTLVPEPELNRVHIYVSSYSLGNAAIGPDCQEPHGYVSIVTVPLDDPVDGATVTKYFLDEDTELATYPLGDIFGNPALGTFTFSACHDMSAFLELGLMAAACLGEAQLWDISDPLNPEFLWRFDRDVVDPAKLDLWHSAAFSWDGEVVAFGDESGGGAFPRCVDPADDQGRVWFLDVETGEELANYKPPRSIEGVCTMHNFNFIPLKSGAKVLVSAAYEGGTTVVDVDALIAGSSESDAEVGFYIPSGADTWSSYWHNGFIFTNDVERGVDVMLLSDKARAGAVKLGLNNPQTQESVIR
ncbi:LVIVD repeat-containing protein [Phytoactinopolyspora endophytica]|uniref:LVIVD repeat-containing protein n=1 Tax=Phytoactinopolyspora endophytica TaxID=1642495 RepID=UPI00101BC052|nr:hypothetical protein [Phytoactinopolyspora endophytica]